MKILILLAVINAVCLKSFAAEDLGVDFPLKSSLEKCLQIYHSEDVQNAPTAYRRGINVEAEKCARQAVQRAFDLKTKALRKKEKNRFAQEVKIHQAFEEALQKYCGFWESDSQECQNTSSFNEETDCQLRLYSFRERQISGRSPLVKKAVAAKNKDVEIFSAYAKQYCLSGQPASEDCQSRLLREIQAALGNLNQRSESCHP